MTDVEPLNDPPDGPHRVESFAMSGCQLVRRVARRDGTVAETAWTRLRGRCHADRSERSFDSS